MDKFNLYKQDMKHPVRSTFIDLLSYMLTTCFPKWSDELIFLLEVCTSFCGLTGFINFSTF